MTFPDSVEAAADDTLETDTIIQHMNPEELKRLDRVRNIGIAVRLATDFWSCRL